MTEQEIINAIQESVDCNCDVIDLEDFITTANLTEEEQEWARDNLTVSIIVTKFSLGYYLDA